MNNKLNTIYLTIIILFSGECAGANFFNLWDVYTLSLKHNEDFDIAKYNLTIQEQQNRQVFSRFLPTIRVGRNFIDTKTDYDTLAVLNSDVSSQQNIISLSQPVFNYVNILSNRKTDTTTDITDLRYLQSVQNSSYDVINAYFSVLDSKINLRQSLKHLSFVKQNLSEIKTKYDFHQATKVDLTEADSSYQSSQLEIYRINNSLSSAKLRLANYIGIDNTDYDVQLPLYEQLVKLDINDNWSYWLELAKKNSYDVRISQSLSNSSDADVDIALSGHLPTVDFSLSYNDTSNDSNSSNIAKTYSLQLSIPIFEGHLVNARVSEAEYRQSQSKLSLKKTHKSLIQNLRIAYDNTQFLEQRIKTLKMLVDVNKLKFDTTKSGFVVGLRTNLEILLASGGLYDSIRDHKQAIHSYILSYFRLETIAGTLSKDDIKLLNKTLFTN